MLLCLSHFFPLYLPSTLHSSTIQHPFPISSCLWVIPINSLAFPLPILSLTSSCLLYASQLCFLFPLPFPSIPSPPTDNPPCVLHFSDSVPVLVVCLVFVFLESVVDSCEFVTILLFIFLIIFFVLDKSL